MSYFNEIRFSDSPNLDAFGRLRVSDATTVFESSFLYDLQPLIYEQRTVTGGTVVHSSTNSCAELTTTSTNGSIAAMRSFKSIRYQPGKSQLVKITFSMGVITNASKKVIGLYDDVSLNGVVLTRETDSGGTTTASFSILSSTSAGDDTSNQQNWNIDKMDGNGPSGKILDLEKAQILFISLQWLGVGRVVVGFSIDGQLYPVHEFLNANNKSYAYMKTATLPIHVSNATIAGASAGSTMQFVCAAVESEGGTSDPSGFTFTTNTSITAASGVRTAAMSIRPRTTFNSIVNRQQLDFLDLSFLVTGTNPVLWELCIGSTFTVAPTYSNVDATYSAMESATGINAGTLNAAGIVIASGLLANGTASSGPSSFSRQFLNLYPLTLDRSGSQRANGTLTLVVTGLSGASDMRCCMNWKEVR